MREYLVNYARTLIYTTAMPPTCLASIKVTYDFLPTPQADALRTHLHELTRYAHGLFSSICSRYRGEPRSIRVDPAVPRSPIVPILTSSPRSLAQHCQQKGFVVRPIVAPTVPKGSERVRVCLHAANTREEVEGLAQAVEDWVRLAAAADGTSTEKSRL